MFYYIFGRHEKRVSRRALLLRPQCETANDICFISKFVYDFATEAI